MRAIILESLQILSVSDRRRFKFTVFFQSITNFLDLLSVALIGALGAVAVNGIKGIAPGQRLELLLHKLGLDNFSTQTQAIMLGLLAIIFLISKTILTLFLSRINLVHLSVISAKTSKRLLGKLLTLQLPIIQSKSTQELIFASTAGVSAVVLGILGSLSSIIADVSLLLILGSALFFYDFQISILTFGVFGLIFFVLFQSVNKRSQNLSEKLTILSIQNSELTDELLKSYRELYVRNGRSYVVDKIGLNRMQSAYAFAEQTWLPSLGRYTLEISITVIGIIVAGIQFLSQDATNAVGSIAIFMTAGARIAPAFLRIQQALVTLNAQAQVAEPTFQIIRLTINAGELPEGKDEVDFSHIGFSGVIEVQNASYSYPDSAEFALTNLNLKVEPGHLVSVVGPSGGGKSTLVDLLLGIIKPQSGSVLISGCEPEICIEKWPGAIAYVPQNSYLTSGSIRSNLGLGFNQSLIEDAVALDSLDRTQLSDFLRGKAEGLDTTINESGGNLSGGERQRLGIARALITHPKVLIMDEATSALDAQTEELVSDTVRKLRGETTVILVAHRLSTVRESDYVVYLDNGKIVASGTFDDVRSLVPNFDQQAQLMGL